MEGEYHGANEKRNSLKQQIQKKVSKQIVEYE